jgi:hypothetical protein
MAGTGQKSLSRWQNLQERNSKAGYIKSRDHLENDPDFFLKLKDHI